MTEEDDEFRPDNIEESVQWLRAKYKRHHELEDMWAADNLENLKAENLGYAKSLLDLEAEVKRLTKQYEALSQAYGLMHGGRK